ncbi:DNA primase, partial [candidate division GN15 bacterium]|nr:DNA primase [candidate division GN15 bacterium]
MIPEDTIDQIRQASDIVDVIGGYLRLKKRGRNFLALCPFHTEKTPSFTVSPEKQIYHCFGCGASGNVFTFLMEHEKMSFVEAARFLAQKANITIREDRQDSARRERMETIAFA